MRRKILFYSLRRSEKNETWQMRYISIWRWSISIYRDCLANVEIRVVGEEEKFKKNRKEKEIDFLAKINSSIRPRSTSSDTARKEHNILIEKSKYIKAIKRDFKFNLYKFCSLSEIIPSILVYHCCCLED